ncbi:MAG: hypothetical protein GY946_16290 [bacterium]|nr:hypothetical protein [bacterium]
MPPAALYAVYAAVMLAALGCFILAYRHRLDLPRHKRFGISGIVLGLGGVAVVIAVSWAFGWTVPTRHADVVWIHRRFFAPASTLLMLLVGISGGLRWRIHTRLYPLLFLLYFCAVATALVGYWPF